MFAHVASSSLKAKESQERHRKNFLREKESFELSPEEFLTTDYFFSPKNPSHQVLMKTNTFLLPYIK